MTKWHQSDLFYLLAIDQEFSKQNKAMQTTSRFLGASDISIQCSMRSFTVRDFMFDNASLKFYTGLEHFDKFEYVLRSLGPAVYQLNYFHHVRPNLSIEDQFFVF